MITRVMLDGDESGAVLSCAGLLSRTWNGWLVPIATEAQVRQFCADVAAGDRNANVGLVLVIDGHLIVRRINEYGEDDDDWWAVCDQGEDGQPLYALNGWCWVLASAEPTG